MKVILAEDNDILRKSLAFFLEANNFEVHQFANGKDALQAITLDRDFDIILTDINMPGISGIEMVQRVRGELFLDLPIIIFTGLDSEENELDSFEVGANEFIPKPVSPSILLVRMKKLLNAVTAK